MSSERTVFFNLNGEIKKAQGDIGTFSALLNLFKNKFENSEKVQNCQSPTQVAFYLKDPKFDVTHKLEDIHDIYDGAVLEARFPVDKPADVTRDELERLQKKINLLEEKDKQGDENPAKKRRIKYELQSDAHVLRVRGLPWGSVEQDVIEFFEEEKIAEDGIYIVINWQGRATGEAYVQFEAAEDLAQAKLRHKKHMRNRYIEVFESDGTEMYRARCPPDPTPLQIQEGSSILRMRGLPFSASEEIIRNFFKDVPIDAVHMTKDSRGRASGEAFVEFPNDDEREKAMAFQKKLIGTRYIELFRLNRAECEMPKFYL